MILLRLMREMFGRGTPPALPRDEAGCDELMDDLWRQGKLMNARESRRNQDLALAVYDAAVANGLLPCDSQFDAAYRRALVATENRPYPLRRRLRFHNLHTLLGTVLHLEGAIAECGCFRGMSSHMMLDRLKAAEPGFAGNGYHIFDSFEGLSEPGPDDVLAKDNPKSARLSEMCQAGAFAASLETVRQGLAAFPAVEFHPGWIPESFTGLPELKYRFIHLDLDLHDPTLAALEYFYPRLVTGGIIVCDDYSWPGARKAIEDFCAQARDVRGDAARPGGTAAKRMIRDAARQERLLADIRRFVREVAIPNEDRVEREDRIPDEDIAAMRRLGSYGWSIPEAYGGAGLTTEELALAFIELSQCSVAYRVHGATNAGIGAEAIIQDGTEEQKRKFLPRLASGEILGCLALTEPDAGSDASSLRASAVKEKDGGHYVLNGTKRYITLAPVADLFQVFARSDPANKGAGGVSAFLIERGTPGLSTSGSTPKMGQEGAPIGEVMLKDCRVPASAIIGGEPGRGFRTVMKVLNKQRVNLAALCTGPAIRMLDEAVAYARERRQFGKPIGEFQLVQAMLAESKIEIEAARALILETARKRDRGEDVTTDVSVCKYFATEMCGRVADRVVQVFGGQGYVKGRGIERFYRDVRAFRIYEGTSQIHLLNIAKQLLR